MTLVQLIILALVQGITEFLPVSSSAHLILVPLLTDWQDQGLTIDVAAHIGSLVAVIFYMRNDIATVLIAGIDSISRRKIENANARIFWYLFFSCLPVLIIGFLLRDVIASYFRSPIVIASASIVFGVLLWYADKSGKRIRQIDSLNIRDAMIIGAAQILAIIPGTSRSGITMTAGLLLGMDRTSAARFSFLMAIPVILAAGGYESLKLILAGDVISMTDFFITFLLSAISALITIHVFIRFIEKLGMLPYVIYRILLGVLLLFLFL